MTDAPKTTKPKVRQEKTEDEKMQVDEEIV